jgi:UDP-4-keto-D-QuiNAc 4-reductase
MSPHLKPIHYGPSVKANFKKVIQFVERGIPLPFGSVDNRRSLLGLENSADLICQCVENEAAKSDTFVVSDGYDVSTADLVRKISVAFNRKSRLFSWFF